MNEITGTANDMTQSWETSLSSVLGNDVIARIVIGVFVALLTLWVAHLVVRALDRVFRASDSPLVSVSLFDNIARGLIYFVGACTILSASFGVDVSTFIAALGVGGLALSLGLRDTLKNLIGGATIVFAKLFRPGDSITIGNQTGVVRDIGWRQTVVVNRAGEVVMVPNANASTSNITITAPLEKASVPFVVTNDRDLDEVASEIAAAAAAAVEPLASLEKQPVVRYSEITESGARGKVVLWTDDGEKVVEVCDAITRAIAPVVR